MVTVELQPARTGPELPVPSGSGLIEQLNVQIESSGSPNIEREFLNGTFTSPRGALPPPPSVHGGATHPEPIKNENQT